MQVSLRIVLASLALVALSDGAAAAEIKVLTAGVMKETILALVPEFERATGHKVLIQNDTAGALLRRIGGGEMVDLAVVTASVIDALVGKGKLVPPRTDLATVGIGVVVKQGRALPDLSSVDAFKRLLLEAKSIAQVDPDSGGTSGIYLMSLYDRLGLADQVKPKLVLAHGGSSAPFVAKGEAEIAIQQISEIVHAPGVAFAGPLPKELQNITTYAAAIGTVAGEAEAARALLARLQSPEGAAALRSRGMEPAAR